MSVLDASYHGNLPLLKSLKGNGEDINIKDEEGNNVLLKACYGTGNIDTVKWLLDEGFSKDYKNKYGYTAFLISAERGHLLLLKFFKEVNVDTTVTDIFGDNALLRACLGTGDFEIVKWLLDEDFSPEYKSNYGYTAFLYSAEKGHLSLLKFFIEIKVDTTVTNIFGDNALIRACYGAGDIETVQWLLDQGFSLQYKNNHGDTGFLVASEQGNLSLLKFLKEVNVDTKVTNISGENAMHRACMGKGGEVNTIKWLLHQDFSLGDTDYDSNTPFIVAAHLGQLKVLKFLKEINVDIMATNRSGNNALHTACMGEEDIPKVKWLLNQGLSMETPNNDGKTAFYLALTKGHIKLVRLFLYLKPDLLNKTLENGDTLLILASTLGDNAVVSSLLEYGADVHLKDSLGRTAQQWAEAKGHKKIVDLLMHHAKQKGECEPFEGLHHHDHTTVKTERWQYNFQNFCSDCQVAIAKQTLNLQPVIEVFGQVGTEFTSYLREKIITQYKRQEIKNAKNDGEALDIIRQALLNSLYPEMMEEILRVLSLPTVGKELHAQKIQEHYHIQIASHQQCEKCKKNKLKTMEQRNH